MALEKGKVLFQMELNEQENRYVETKYLITDISYFPPSADNADLTVYVELKKLK